MATLEHDRITWRDVDSSNVAQIGWPHLTENETLVWGMPYDPKIEPHVIFVRFRNGQTYAYLGVSRQRAVWITRAPSAGQYINQVIKPQFPSLRVPELDRG